MRSKEREKIETQERNKETQRTKRIKNETEKKIKCIRFMYHRKQETFKKQHASPVQSVN